MRIIKPLSTSISFTAANNVSTARVVYVMATANSLVTVKTAGGATKGSFVIIAPHAAVFVEKDPTDTIESNVAIHATSIAFKG